jgi:hypothetical protein
MKKTTLAKATFAADDMWALLHGEPTPQWLGGDRCLPAPKPLGSGGALNVRARVQETEKVDTLQTWSAPLRSSTPRALLRIALAAAAAAAMDFLCPADPTVRLPKPLATRRLRCAGFILYKSRMECGF